MVVALLAAAAALVYTYPLAFYWREAIPYGIAAEPGSGPVGLVPGDHLQLYYYLTLLRDMWDGRIPWFSDPYQFSAPQPIQRFNLSFLPFSAIFLLAEPLGGPAAYNVLVWLSYVGTALAVFGLARGLGQGDLAAGIGAAIATLLPYRVANAAGGYPSGLLFFLLPLLFYLLERAWQRRSLAAAAGAAFVLIVLATNEPHFIYFLAFLLPVWTGSVFWRSSASAPPATAGERVRSRLWLLLAAVGPSVYYATYAARHWELSWHADSFCQLLAMFWVIAWCLWRVSGEIRARVGAPAWVAEAASYTPLLLLALYPIQVAADLPKGGTAIVAMTLLGLAAAKWPLVSAVRAGVKGLRPFFESLRPLWPFALGLAVALGFMLELKSGSLAVSKALGGRTFRDVILFSPRAGDFFVFESARPVYVGVATLVLAMAGLWVPAGRVLALVAAFLAVLTVGSHTPQGLPLYRIAFEVVPFFSLIRQSAKFFAVVGLALALAAGFGFERAGRAVGPRLRVVAFAVVLAAVLVDFARVLPLWMSAMPPLGRAYSIVAERGKGTNLLELPLWPGDSHHSSIYLYWAAQTKVAMVNGYNPIVPRDYIERVEGPLESLNLGEMSADQFRLAREVGVRFVTLHRDAFPPKVSAYPYRYTLGAMRRNPNLEFVAEDQGVYLFDLRAGDYRPWDSRAPSPLGVFFEAESLAGVSPKIADPAASGGVLVRGAMVQPPFPVVCGPYRAFPAGRYRVRFRTRGAGRLDVATDGGEQVLVSDGVASTEFRETALDVDLDRVRKLEFRAWPTWAGDLDVDWVLVEKVDRAEGSIPGRIEAEELPALMLFDQEDPDASAGAFAVVGGPAGKVVRDGPYRYFRPGRIRVAVRSRGAAFVLAVESADGRRRYAELAVPASADWTTTEAELELPAVEVLCTRIISSGLRADADWVELAAVGSRSGP